MSNVVNKLIFNCLVQYGNVALPEVGSLKVEGDPKKVSFAEGIEENNILVTDLIAEQGGLPAEEAKALYNDWLTSATTEEGIIRVEGVGTITLRHFAIDNELNHALNGEALPTATLRKRCRCRWIWWFVALLLVGAAVALYFCPCDCLSALCGSSECGQCTTAEMEVESACDEECVEVEPSVVPYEEQNVAIAVTPAPAATKPATKPAEKGADYKFKRYNVSVGVFSIKYNARACAKQDPLNIGSANYIIAPYPGGRWIVIAYETDDLMEAEGVRRHHQRTQRDVWVYKHH